MCVIAAVPKGEDFKQEWFDNCWDSNPDGGGYSFTTEAGLLVTKHFMDKEEMRKALDEDRTARKNDSAFTIHFRIASHGTKCLENCHPFVVHNNLIMAHNGNLPIKPKEGGIYSDTRTFVEFVLQKIPRLNLMNPGLSYFIDVTCGDHNKLVFMNRDGKFTVFNQHKGTAEGNVWFSNTTYKWKKSSNVVSRPNPTPAGTGQHGAGGYSRQNDNKLPLVPCPWCINRVKQTDYDYKDKACKDCLKGASRFKKMYPGDTPAAVKSRLNLWREVMDVHYDSIDSIEELVQGLLSPVQNDTDPFPGSKKPERSLIVAGEDDWYNGDGIWPFMGA